MCLYGAAHGWGRAKWPPSLKSVAHALQLYLIIIHSYTLPKEDAENT